MPVREKAETGVLYLGGRFGLARVTLHGSNVRDLCPLVGRLERTDLFLLIGLFVD
jgi:hypothetical protein